MSPSKVSTITFDDFYNIINGEKRLSETQHYGIDPTTGDKLWPVPIGNQKDVDEAVNAAKKAFKSYKTTTLAERKALLEKFRDALLSYGDEMTHLLSTETGKPTKVAEGEAKHSVAAFFNHHLSLTIPEDRVEDKEKIITTTYTPLGVVGAICPWNFPISLSLGKIVPALLTGNAIIVKPSPFTPYTALKLVEIAQNFFPPGVLQAINGDDNLGPMLTAHPDVAKISFTGSSATGKRIMAACSHTLKRITLELGGNNASIILPDVDVQQTARELVLGAFANSGQFCLATKRIYIHKDIYEPVLTEMVAFTKTLRVGAPSEGASIGPVQNSMQYERVKGFYEDCQAHGYKFATGAKIPSGKGFFLNPAIIDSPPTDSRIMQEEPFGPIVPCQSWEDEDEIIARANASKAGLGACVWSTDVARAEAIGKRLEAGSVWINSREKPTPQAFISGHKESGIGGEFGTEGIKAYCNAQVMHTYKI